MVIFKVSVIGLMFKFKCLMLGIDTGIKTLITRAVKNKFFWFSEIKVLYVLNYYKNELQCNLTMCKRLFLLISLVLQ